MVLLLNMELIGMLSLVGAHIQPSENVPYFLQLLY